jgi:hypothetical protein
MVQADVGQRISAGCPWSALENDIPKIAHDAPNPSPETQGQPARFGLRTAYRECPPCGADATRPTASATW